MFGSETDLFTWIDDISQNGDGETAFERLAERLTREKRYPLLFNMRLMKTRLDLGLPLVSQPAIGDLPKEIQQTYQDEYIRAAIEVGELYLADGNIPRAWPYLRAGGKERRITDALATFEAPPSDTPEAQELLNATIQIAFQEGLHPRKGLELILEHHGMCRAITMFGAYPHRDGRDESLQLLVQSLHAELLTNLKRAIAATEGQAPETDSIAQLIAGREWLFDNNAQYTDSSHLSTVLRYSCDLSDETCLLLAIEIAAYGTHLGPMFRYEEGPLFDCVYEDRGIYLRALVGEHVHEAVRHFEEKAERVDPEQYGNASAEALVKLLLRLGRHAQAAEVFRRFLSDVNPQDLSCPSLPELCEMAGDFERLKQVAKEQGDPLSYMAGVLQGRKAEGKTQKE
jgi:tetratricopeptide (TPR) repeat protein